MEEWKLNPAPDLDLGAMERYRSHRREGGLIESIARLGFWGLLRASFGTWNRLRIIGREHLPAEPPFVLVANHASHLDALLLTTVLPLRLRDQTFPIAARDVFFESLPLAAVTATFVNALPVYRKAIGGHGLASLRQRLLNEPAVLILFPEGGRTRDGTMQRFKPGIGMLVAGTSVPVVPCFIKGTFEAMPPKRWLLRPNRLTIRVGQALKFDEQPNERAGWEVCAQRLEIAVAALAEATKWAGCQ
jgi:1-acyl-sn-glycerol-3-phosphate acyltransferase